MSKQSKKGSSQRPARPPKVAKPKSKQVLASTVSLLPAAREQKLRSAMNIMARSDLSYIRIRGREPIRTVQANTAFSLLTDEYINPLNPVLFPKLSQEAALYDKWRPIKLKLEYAPRCPTSLTGQVGGLILPDSHLSEAPATMIELDRYEHSFSAAPWTAGECTYQKKYDAQMWYYTAPPAEFSGSAIGTVRTQSSGVVQIAVSDAAIADVGKLCGTMYLEYDIEFCERRPPYVSAFSLTPTPFNRTGSGGTAYYQDPLTTASAFANALGFPGLFTSSDISQVIAAVSGATATYIAAVGASGPLSSNYFMKLHKGTTRVLSFMNFRGVTTPLRDMVSQRTHAEVRHSGVVSPRDIPPPPKLVRQVACSLVHELETKSEVPDPVDFGFIELKKDGIAYGSNDGVNWEPLPIASDASDAVLAANDIQAFWVMYDPVTNVSTYPWNPSVVNSSSTYEFIHKADISVSTDYPVYLIPSYSMHVAVGSSRITEQTLTALNSDST